VTVVTLTKEQAALLAHYRTLQEQYDELNAYLAQVRDTIEAFAPGLLSPINGETGR
jgi:hypothetical protein